MNMKYIFSAAGIAAVLLSGTASAETLSLGLAVDADNNGFRYETDGSEGAPEVAAGFSIGISSRDCGGPQYCNDIWLSPREPLSPEIRSGYRLDNFRISDGTTSTIFLSEYSYSSRTSDSSYSGLYILNYGHINNLHYSYATDLGDSEIYHYEGYEDYDENGVATGGWSGELFTQKLVKGEEVFSSKVSFSEDAPEINALFKTVQDTRSVSGFDMFDFENTIIHYENDSFASLAQILQSDALNSSSIYDNFAGNWASDSPITSITVAYGIPAVPEAETWAMLLAGLGLIGGIARRRRGLRA